MIKENKDFFLYVLGIIALSFLMMFIFDYINPGVISTGECGILRFKCWFRNEKSYKEAPQMSIDTSKDYKAIVKTNLGDFEIDLYEKNASVTVNNFVFLANEDYYDEVKFHRVIRGLLIQVGDRNTLDSNIENDGQGGPGYTFEDEINWDSLNFSRAKKQQLLKLGFSTNKKVTSRHLKQRSVAMANSDPDTNGSQFFFVTANSDNPTITGLEGRHTVFGEVILGWEIIEKIENSEVDDPSSNSPRPIEDIVISDIEIKVS